MKIVLIRPNIGMLEVNNGKTIPFSDKGAMEPLQLGVLAGLTPKDIEVELFDDRMEDIDYDIEADFIAITVEIYTAKRAYEIATEYRNKGKIVVLGGVHVSSMPDEALEFADAIVVGDAEKVWLKLINDFKSGNLQKRYISSAGIGHPGHIPNRDIYLNKSYLPISLLQYGRGCPFVCSFCSTGLYFKGKLFTRNVDEVINEIKQQNRKLLFFVDDNIIGNKAKAKELFRALIPLRINWMSQASLDMTEDDELMDLMQQSGCVGLVIGFESISPEGLDAYHKVQNRFVNYDKQIEIIKKHGIHIWAAFLLGHDSETKETLKATLDFAIKHKFSFAAFNILMPYPNTSTYAKLEKENRLLFDGKWWLSDDYRFNYAAFNPKNMSHKELTAYCFYMRKRYNSFPIIVKRLFSKYNLLNPNNFKVLWNFIWLFRRETFKKQKMHMGYKTNS